MKINLLVLGSIALAVLQPQTIVAQSSAPATSARVLLPDFVLKQQLINEYRSKLLTNSKITNSPMSRADAETKIQIYAKELLNDIDIKSIPPKDASDWASLFEQAGEAQKARQIQEQALSYHSVQLMFTEAGLLGKLLKEGKDNDVVFLLRHAPDYMASQIGMIGEVFYNAAQGTRYTQNKPVFVEKCLRILLSKVDTSPTTLMPKASMMADFVAVDLQMKILEMNYANTHDPKVIAQIKRLRGQYVGSKSTNAFGQSPVFRVDEFLKKQTLIGAKAPPLTADKTIGKFDGIASLSGKVVILDFMAHWCGPCKVELPHLAKLHEMYGSQGLKLLSVTSFYGYYGSKSGISPADEYQNMLWFVKQFNITWPVIFDIKQNSHLRYGVTGIPHMVFIDRKGNIRHTQVGTGEQADAESLSILKKLLAEKD